MSLPVYHTCQKKTVIQRVLIKNDEKREKLVDKTVQVIYNMNYINDNVNVNE